MLSEAHYEAALNYFYFLLLDEGAALHCALKAVKRAEKKYSNPEAKNPDEVLIFELAKMFRQNRKKNPALFGSPPKSDWKTPNAEVLAEWKGFIKRSEVDSAEALVLRYILGYPIKAISLALGIPEGTVYFRLGRGLEAFSGGKS